MGCRTGATLAASESSGGARGVLLASDALRPAPAHFQPAALPAARIQRLGPDARTEPPALLRSARAGGQVPLGPGRRRRLPNVAVPRQRRGAVAQAGAAADPLLGRQRERGVVHPLRTARLAD